MQSENGIHVIGFVWTLQPFAGISSNLTIYWLRGHLSTRACTAPSAFLEPGPLCHTSPMEISGRIVYPDFKDEFASGFGGRKFYMVPVSSSVVRKVDVAPCTRQISFMKSELNFRISIS